MALVTTGAEPLTRVSVTHGSLVPPALTPNGFALRVNEIDPCPLRTKFAITRAASAFAPDPAATLITLRPATFTVPRFCVEVTAAVLEPRKLNVEVVRFTFAAPTRRFVLFVVTAVLSNNSVAPFKPPT